MTRGSFMWKVRDFLQMVGVIVAVAIPVLLWLASALAIPALAITAIWWLLSH